MEAQDPVERRRRERRRNKVRLGVELHLSINFNEMMFIVEKMNDSLELKRLGSLATSTSFVGVSVPERLNVNYLSLSFSPSFPLR